MALAVPLSRFTSRVGGGSAFFVRQQAHAMKSFIRNLPAPAEFFIVVSLWFDLLLLGGCFLLPKFLQSGYWEVGNASIIRSAIFQVMALVALIWIGNIRGWPLSKFGTAISWKGTGGGILLAGVTRAVSYGLWSLCAVFFHSKHPNIIESGLVIPLMISTTIIIRFSRRWRRPVILCTRLADSGCGLRYWRVLVADALPCALGWDRWADWHFCDRPDICICLLALEAVVATCHRPYTP